MGGFLWVVFCGKLFAVIFYEGDLKGWKESVNNCTRILRMSCALEKSKVGRVVVRSIGSAP